MNTRKQKSIEFLIDVPIGSLKDEPEDNSRVWPEKRRSFEEQTGKAPSNAPAPDETDARIFDDKEEREEFYKRRSLNESIILRKKTLSIPGAGAEDEERAKSAPATKRRTRLSSITSRLFGMSLDDDEETSFVTEEDSEDAKSFKRVLKGTCDDDERAQIEDEFENGDEVLEQIWRSPLKLISLDPIRNDQYERETKEAEHHLLFSKFHLAIIYNNASLLEIMYKRMKSDREFCDKVLKQKASVEYGWIKEEKKYKVPCELFELPTLHLTMKYNDDIFARMLQIAKDHGGSLMDEVLQLEDKRGFNLLHIAAYQKTKLSLNIILDVNKERRTDIMVKLYNSRTQDMKNILTIGEVEIKLDDLQSLPMPGLWGMESPLHTVRSQEVLDFLLDCRKGDKNQESFLNMLSSRDARGFNVLRALVARDENDIAMRFLDHHLRFMSDRSSATPAICLDLSPMIGEASETGDEESGGVERKKTEAGVISQMMPLTSRSSELLDHPIVNTFIMIKYNSYAHIIFLTILIKFLTSLALSKVLFDLFPPEPESKLPKCLNNTMVKNVICDAPTDPESAGHQGLKGETLAIMIPLILICLYLISHTLFNMIQNFKKLWGKHGSAFFFQLLGVINYSAILVFFLVYFFGTTSPYCMQMCRCAAAVLVAIHWASLTTSLRFLMIGRLYNLGFYVRMLDQIIQKVAFFVLLYTPILVGFTLGFHILMPDVFEGSLQISRTVAMTIGEFDYDDKFGQDIASSTLFSRVMFVIFAILCPIILSNLLIGLTVSDVEDLIKNAHISGLGFKVRIIDLLDDSWTMKLLSYFAKKCTRQSHLISYHDNSRQVAIKPHNKHKNLLSPEPITNIFEVHNNKKGEREIGESWSYLGISTFVPISVVKKAEEAIKRLENTNNRGDKTKRGNRPCSQCGKP